MEVQAGDELRKAQDRKARTSKARRMVGEVESRKRKRRRVRLVCGSCGRRMNEDAQNLRSIRADYDAQGRVRSAAARLEQEGHLPKKVFACHRRCQMLYEVNALRFTDIVVRAELERRDVVAGVDF